MTARTRHDSSHLVSMLRITKMGMLVNLVDTIEKHSEVGSNGSQHLSCMHGDEHDTFSRNNT